MGTELEYLRSNSKSICRTCYEISLHLHPLHEKTEFKTKVSKTEQLPSLADLLFDIAKIDTKQQSNNMPGQLCGNCSRKLKNAYNFVQRAQEVNDRLLQYEKMMNMNEYETPHVSKPLDCLLEAPIDIPSDAADFLKIKVEAEYADDTIFDSFSLPDNMENIFDNTERCREKDKEVKDIFGNFDEEDDYSLANIKNKNSSSTIQLKNEGPISESTINDLRDPIKTLTNAKRKLRSTPESVYESSNCNDSDSDWEEIPKRRRSARYRKRSSECKGRYSCKECGKTFAWKKDLTRHSLSHNPNQAYQCDICQRNFTRKDKLNDHLKVHQRKKGDGGQCCGRRTRHPEWNFAERLYSKKRFKKIECKLCASEFKSTHQLRSHLYSHTDRSALDMLHLNSEIFKLLYPHAIQDLNELKEQIWQDISQHRFGKFYDIINEYGYELSLSDSDADNELDSVKYNCELCSEKFSRKFEAFYHLKDKHANDSIPYKCNVCKVEFVCCEMFEVHTRTQCRNKEKKYQCLKCPGKFMWVKNLDNHNCSNRFNSAEYKAQLPKKHEILQCNVCEKTFLRRKDLRRHKESHDSAGTSLECTICCQRFLKVNNLRLHYKQIHRQVCRRIECALCSEKFSLLKQLREHLPLHADGSTGIKSESGLFFITYASLFSKDDVDVAQIICKGFESQNISRFYLAVDESGNELDLCDSETDVEIGMASDAQQKVLYKCDICLQEFDRRKKILLHQHAEHEELQTLPHRCEQCSKQFVCPDLLQNHVRTDCSNIYKRWNCNKCSARFVWDENLQAHLSIKHIDPEQQISRKLANKLQCDECDKTFIWPKDLNRHKRCHLPDDEKYECRLCPRRFNRKDNMQAHMKIHGALERVPGTLKKDVTRIGKQSRVKAVDENLCKPNGCKLIQCMVCFSKHTKISDLRTHLRTHQYVVSLSQRGKDEDITDISMQLYPNEEPMNQEEVLIKRIMADVSERHWDRFYSITNEVGYELNISDSETESDSEEEQESTRRSYACELCTKEFDRKYKLFEHQKYMHEWLDLPHTCDICDARFASANLLQIHQKTLCQNYQKRFLCKKCPLKFMWKDNLKTHERTLHPEKCELKKKYEANRYECQECSRTFAWQKDLTRHLVQHQPEAKAFNCFWCPRRFHRKDKLYVHIKRHNVTPQCLAAAESYTRANNGPNGKKEILCKVCDVKFSSIFSLRSHLLQSSFDVGFTNLGAIKVESPCPQHHSYSSLRNYSITNQLGFELHIDDSESDTEGAIIPKAEGTPLKYSCELCELEFSRKYEVAQHQLIAHPYEQMPRKCEKCFFRTASKNILDHHMRTQCFNLEKEFRCKICSLKFMWQENLSRHIQCIHPQENQPKEEASRKSKLKRSFQCDQCKCKYNRKDRLTAHVRKVHTKGEELDKTNDASQIDPTTGKQIQKPQLEKKFLCAFCGRAVTSSSNLIIHMRRHTGEKPFKCEFCDMAFPRSSDLQCHRRTHTGEKPHKCAVCDKAFSRSYKLQTHMRIHSGERPYKCTYCEKSFTQSNDLTLHIRRHTGERPYVCGICGERFIQGTALKNHRTMRGHYEDVEPRKLSVLEQF